MLDTSVMVAAVSTWHQHHAAALSELERRLSAGDEMVVAGHSAAEAYAVLTRLPAPHRMSVDDAARLILVNFVENADVIALDVAGYRSLLDRARTLGIGGGQTYDLVIAESARLADVPLLLTFNDQHFRRVPDLEIVVPTEAN